MGRHKSASPAEAIQTPKADAPAKDTLMVDVSVAGRLSPNSGNARPGSTMTDASGKTGEIKDKVEGAKRTMDQNITLATQRGEALEDLQDKTQQVSESSKQFSKNAAVVKKNLWWKNFKMTLIIVFIVIIIVAIIGVSIYFQSK